MNPFGICSPIMQCPTDDCGRSAFVLDTYVNPRITGGTEVHWQLNPRVRLATPVTFCIEFNRAGHSHAEDWEQLTGWKADITFAVDHEHRAAGWYQKTYYRVVAKDGNGVKHYGPPVSAVQFRMNGGQRRMYREIVRREQKRNRQKNTPASLGYLLKVRYYGQRCQACIDPDSGEPVRDDCDVCFGIGYEYGYHPPYPCFGVDLGPGDHHLTMMPEQGSFIQGGVHTIRYLNIPTVSPWDVWVDAATDHRYMIGNIQPTVVFGAFEVLCRAAAARLSFDHPVYRIDMPRGEYQAT